MPTADELLSQDRPFFRTADYLKDPKIASSLFSEHVDNLFRLLREDMLGDIREELKILTGAKHGRHKGFTFDNLEFIGVELGSERKRPAWGVKLQAKSGLPHLNNIIGGKRKEYLIKNRDILRQGSIACLFLDNEPAAFPIIFRIEEELAKIPAALVVQLQDDATLPYALAKMKVASHIKIVQLDTAVFAYEPILRRLQSMTNLALVDNLLRWEEGAAIQESIFQPRQILKQLEKFQGQDIKHVLGTNESIVLDASQTKSLEACLSQEVSVIQGPPGMHVFIHRNT
jgi:hypothetical protein